MKEGEEWRVVVDGWVGGWVGCRGDGMMIMMVMIRPKVNRNLAIGIVIKIVILTVKVILPTSVANMMVI